MLCFDAAFDFIECWTVPDVFLVIDLGPLESQVEGIRYKVGLFVVVLHQLFDLLEIVKQHVSCFVCGAVRQVADLVVVILVYLFDFFTIHTNRIPN